MGRIAIGLLVALMLASCGEREQEVNARALLVADLLLTGGKIITLNEGEGNQEALAIVDGKILAVGSVKEMEGHRGPNTKVIPLDGRTVVPGFIEGHAHFVGIGESAQSLDLSKAQNWEAVVALVEAAAKKAKPGAWIVGRGWHQEKWTAAPADAVKGFPVHADFSKVTPDNPAYLLHASGHACLANERALEAVGLNVEREDPPGGEIMRGEDGEPTGILLERAIGYVTEEQQVAEARRPVAVVEAELRDQILEADRICRSKGITSFQDAGTSFKTIDLFREMLEAGQIKTRLYVMVGSFNPRLRHRLSDYRTVGEFDQRLTVRAMKVILDGALGSRGAWLLEPYDDDPSTTGLQMWSEDEFAESVALAKEHGYQLCVHAIGDRANREVLDVFESSFASSEELRESRWRIEHAQHLHPDDIPRFGELGVIASMQGIHCTSDAPFVVARLGQERSRVGAYAWRALLDSGALVINGTDAPVEDVDPIPSYYASVTRKLSDGTQFFPEQAMTRLEALKSYTVNAAEAAFEEDIKGTLTPGKLADVVVLSKDITSIPEEEILEARVDYTIIGGEIVYRKKSD